MVKTQVKNTASKSSLTNKRSRKKTNNPRGLVKNKISFEEISWEKNMKTSASTSIRQIEPRFKVGVIVSKKLSYMSFCFVEDNGKWYFGDHSLKTVFYVLFGSHYGSLPVCCVTY